MGLIWIFWLIVCIIFSIAEMAYSGFFLIWFAAGALAALFTSFFTSNIIIQSTVFLVVSFVLLITLTKKLTIRFQGKQTIATNIDALIGRTGTVLEAIGPDDQTGIVKLDGEHWTARSTTGITIPKGTLVVAEQIKGVRLFVSPITQRKGD
ncbi:MAG: NfeD family protein [Cellulosilyticaceae bacterium]